MSYPQPPEPGPWQAQPSESQPTEFQPTEFQPAEPQPSEPQPMQPQAQEWRAPEPQPWQHQQTPPEQPSLYQPWPPYEGPSYEAPPVVKERKSRWAALLVFVVVAASGAALGWLWAVAAPRLAVVKVDGGFLYAESEPEQPIAADGWFAIIGAGAGILFAVLVWVLLRRYRGIAVLVGLTLGSLVGAVLASWVGYKIGYAQFVPMRDAAAIGDQLDAPLSLAMTNLDPDDVWKFYPTGVAAVQALLAVFTYTFLAGFSAFGDLRGEAPDENPVDQLGPGLAGSSDSAIGTART